MLSKKIAFAGLSSYNDHQPARARARTKVAVNLEILESRELLNGAHPRFVQAKIDLTEFRVMHLNAEVSNVGLKFHLHNMNVAQERMNSRWITFYPAGGPTYPAAPAPPPKLTLLSMGITSASSSSPTSANIPLPAVSYTAPSNPSMTLIQTPISSLPSQPGSTGTEPTSAPNGLPTSSAPSTTASAPIVPIDVITSGPVFY
jgi:hypothetical protein